VVRNGFEKHEWHESDLVILIKKREQCIVGYSRDEEVADKM
jgi:hypothetical protein